MTGVNPKSGEATALREPLFPPPPPLPVSEEQPFHYLVYVPPSLSYYHRHHRHHRHLRRSSLLSLIFLFLFGSAVYLLWPSDPTVEIARLRLNYIRVHTNENGLSPSAASAIAVAGFPSVAIDVSMDLTLKISNGDFFGVDFRSILVRIGYRGNELGFVRSEGGKVKARGVSYVNATLNLDGIQVLHDAIYLLEDLSIGTVPFDSSTNFEGSVSLFFVDLPLKVNVSCEVYVDTNSHLISHQYCLPD